MELSTSVSQLVAMVAPALPYLMQKVDQAADAAVEKLGRKAWEHARGLWAKLWPRIEDKEAAREAAETLAADPSDEDARAALRMTLKKLLAEDAELAQVLADLLGEARQAGVTVTASGERSVAVGRDAGTIITGDGNVVGGDG